MRRLSRTMRLPTLLILMIISANMICSAADKSEKAEAAVTVSPMIITIEPINYPVHVENENSIMIEESLEGNDSLSDEDIALIALVTMAEAEGECEEGKRLVIDTILNRVDSEHFPDTVHETVYQKNQFSSMWNGRVDRCTVRNDICQLVREELESRQNYEVMFFTAGQYGNYGTPMFQVGNHYFSSYE